MKLIAAYNLSGSYLYLSIIYYSEDAPCGGGPSVGYSPAQSLTNKYN
jgi:hypothetical protein